MLKALESNYFRKKRKEGNAMLRTMLEKINTKNVPTHNDYGFDFACLYMKSPGDLNEDNFGKIKI